MKKYRLFELGKLGKSTSLRLYPTDTRQAGSYGEVGRISG